MSAEYISYINDDGECVHGWLTVDCYGGVELKDMNGQIVSTDGWDSSRIDCDKCCPPWPITPAGDPYPQDENGNPVIGIRDDEGDPFEYDHTTGEWIIPTVPTTTVVKNPDGSITVTTYNPDGSVKESETSEPADGYTTVKTNPDGSVTITTWDGDGNQTGTTTIPADSVLSCAEVIACVAPRSNVTGGSSGPWTITQVDGSTATIRNAQWLAPIDNGDGTITTRFRDNAGNLVTQKLDICRAVEEGGCGGGEPEPTCECQTETVLETFTLTSGPTSGSALTSGDWTFTSNYGSVVRWRANGIGSNFRIAGVGTGNEAAVSIIDNRDSAGSRVRVRGNFSLKPRGTALSGDCGLSPHPELVNTLLGTKVGAVVQGPNQWYAPVTLSNMSGPTTAAGPVTYNDLREYDLTGANMVGSLDFQYSDTEGGQSRYQVQVRRTITKLVCSDGTTTDEWGNVT